MNRRSYSGGVCRLPPFITFEERDSPLIVNCFLLAVKSEDMHAPVQRDAIIWYSHVQQHILPHRGLWLTMVLLLSVPCWFKGTVIPEDALAALFLTRLSFLPFSAAALTRDANRPRPSLFLSPAAPPLPSPLLSSEQLTVAACASVLLWSCQKECL